MTTAPNYQSASLVSMLREQNRLVIHIVHSTRGTKGAERNYRKVSTQLLKQLLGRVPTADEIEQVCDW